jgi:FAD/FMN-containing dehydrogenase
VPRDSQERGARRARRGEEPQQWAAIKQAALRGAKAALDPAGALNPGVLIDPA